MNHRRQDVITRRNPTPTLSLSTHIIITTELGRAPAIVKFTLQDNEKLNFRGRAAQKNYWDDKDEIRHN